jgi:PAS domain S-box-containing protein
MTTTNYTLRTVTDLEPGDHLCCVYKTAEERRVMLTAFIRQGLERGEKTLFIKDAPTDERILDYLQAEGLEVKAFLASGQLNLLTVDEAYLRDGVFDPDRMIAMLQAETDRALAEGYAALRVTGGTAWVQQGQPGSERLIEYEQKLSTFFPGSKCLGLCQYDQRHFDSELLLSVLTSHPTAIVDMELYDNFYYIPPAELLNRDLPEVTLDHWLQNLVTRKRAEEAQRESEERYSSLVETTKDVIFTLSTDETITSLNPAFERVTGWSRTEWLGKSFIPLIHPDDVPVAMKLFRSALQKKTLPLFELRVLSKSGEYTVGEFRVTLQIRGGKVAGLFGIVRDITARRRAEAARSALEARLTSLLDIATDAIIMVDGDQHILVFNQGAEQIFGYHLEEVLGQPLDLLLPSHLDERHREHIRTFAAGSEQARHMGERREVFGRRKDGTQFPAEASIAKLTYGGQMTFVVILHDITRRIQVQEALQQQAEIIDQIHDSVVSTDLDGYVTSWNKGAERLFGYKAGEALGRHISFVYPEDQHEFLQQEVIKPLKATGRHEVEVQMRKKSGDGFYAHLSLSLLRDKRGTVTGMIGYSMDITERVRVEIELRARERQQAVVANLGQRALAGTDLAVLMDEAVALVAQTLAVEYSKVLELLPDGEELLLRAGVGWQEGYVGHVKVKAKTASQAGYTLLSTGPVIVEDLRTETRFSGPPLLTEHGVVSGVSVIIHSQERPWGILGAHTIHQRKFTKDDIHFLEAVANLLAMAIERKGAEERLKGYVLRLEVLRKIDQAILSAQSSEEIARAVLRYIRQLLEPCQHASVSLFDFEADEAIQLAVSVNGDTRVEEGKHIPLGDFVDIVNLRQGQPYRVDDINAMDSLPATDEQLLAEGLRSYINVPLVSQGQLIGSLNLGTSAPGAFSPEHVEIARQVADPLAIVIRQARLFEQLDVAHKQLQALSRRLVEAEETERRRIAHELHDEIGQALTAIHINLQTLQHPMDRAEFMPRLEENIDIVEQTLQQVRNLSLDLRPSSLDDLGLVATLRWYVDRQSQRGGFDAQFVAEPSEIELPPALEISCFRVVQEALTNVLRYAQAQRVRVELRKREAELRLTIHDDGVGFDVQAALNRAARGASLGLLGMQERVLLGGGQIDLESRPEHGATIRVRFPLAPAAPDSLLSNLGQEESAKRGMAGTGEDSRRDSR